MILDIFVSFSKILTTGLVSLLKRDLVSINKTKVAGNNNPPIQSLNQFVNDLAQTIIQNNVITIEQIEPGVITEIEQTIDVALKQVNSTNININLTSRLEFNLDRQDITLALIFKPKVKTPTYEYDKKTIKRIEITISQNNEENNLTIDNDNLTIDNDIVTIDKTQMVV